MVEIIEEVNVRIATRNDIPAIINIAQEWIPFKKEALEQRRKTLEEIFNDKGRIIFIAEYAGEVIGWFEVQSYKDWFMLRKSIHIEHVNVLAKYRCKKVGSKVLQAIFKYYENREEDMYIIFWYTESSWNGFWETHNHMQNSGQKFFIKLDIKKLRDKRDDGDGEKFG